MRLVAPCLALIALVGAIDTARAGETPWMPELKDLDTVLPVTRDQDVRVTGIVGDSAFVVTPDGKTTVAVGDLVRYRGELYRIRFDDEHLALIAVEGQDSVLLPVRGDVE